MVDTPSYMGEDDVPLLQQDHDVAFYLNAFINGDLPQATRQNTNSSNSDDDLVNDTQTNSTTIDNDTLHDDDVRLLGSELLDYEVDQHRVSY